METFFQSLEAVWELVMQEPLAFFTVAILIFSGGWLVGRFTFSNSLQIASQRNEQLKERVDEYREKLSGKSPDEAQIRFEQLEAQLKLLQPRRLDPDQKRKLKQALSNTSGSISVAHDGVAADAKLFADELAIVFGEAGWRTSHAVVMGYSPQPKTGVSFTVQDAEHLDAAEMVVRSALIAAEIPFDLRVSPRSRRTWPEGMQHFEPDVRLVITNRINE
ncbi:hypothetical protein D5400_11790 [Georhizobium profundi]|uniref:Uncharacterized protein n=1 Tax=Georhizobium profundi TaxID=2341112 RepID=A0A3Q8XNW3_9HYPH|nr:hypothetical protein [Georhizobium profundi]AZN71870.1 hypothetical protein D5400_11790 [Georhizobium profundi]